MLDRTGEMLVSTNLGVHRGHHCNKEDFESREAVGVATHVLLQRDTLLDLTRPCRCRPTDITSSSQRPPSTAAPSLSEHAVVSVVAGDYSARVSHCHDQPYPLEEPATSWRHCFGV
jgi:hypothetical protein